MFILKFIFNFYVEYPSNYDNKFLRIRIRKLLEELEKEGLDNKKFNSTLNNLRYSDQAIKFYVKQNLRENSLLSSKKGQSILSNNFFLQPYEIVFRSLTDLIKTIGKKYYPVRGKKLEKIIKEIQKKRPFKATLGGCIIKKVNQTVIIVKEY